MAATAQNPILAGFYPDPSICAVGEDFYLVNSSFAYFPGLPVFHSRDLAHWEQIGNVMTRDSQLPLQGTGISRGLFAPTIRYHDGTFYVICTNVSGGGNFIVTSDKPEGPYSEPHYLEGADGIDPSLFFDDDGKCYYIGTHDNADGPKYYGDNSLYIYEVDIENFCLKGEVHNVWTCAVRDVPWPEGPHLYKKGDYYYIIYAEGGTGPEHSVCVVRSKEIFGPYENCFCNPIFTHRHLGVKYPIRYTGHADIVEASNGDWYMVMLAVRPIRGFTTLGRETFLARVIWENDWPVVNPGLGMLSAALKIDLPEWIPDSQPNVNRRYLFHEMDSFGPEFLFLRNPKPEHYEFTEEGLFLTCTEDLISGNGAPTYAAIRQDTHCFEASCMIKAEGLYDGACAGIALIQNEDYQIRFEYSGVNGNVILRKGGEEEKIATKLLAQEYQTLIINVIGTSASFFMIEDRKRVPLIQNVDISSLSTEVAGGFVGCTVGIYAQDSEKREVPVKALFKGFTYDRLRLVREEIKAAEKEA